jgi:hypothetical protein
MGAGLPPTDLRTHYLNPQSVVVEVAKAVGLSLQNLHLGVEAFGDSVIPREPPHRGDLLSPGVQRVAELNHLGQLLLSQQGDHPQQLRSQFPALVVIEPFVQKPVIDTGQYLYGSLFPSRRPPQLTRNGSTSEAL